MIIVDSSVWIDFFNGTTNSETDRLADALTSEPVGLGDLILTEVLQGFRRERDARTAERVLTSMTVFDMLGETRALAAAERYRLLRRRGVTVRKTADVVIASFCLSEGHRLLASDRDFDPFTRELGLLRA